MSSADHHTVVPVTLGQRSYNIHIGSGVLAEAGRHILPLLPRPYTAIVTDETVAENHLNRLQVILQDSGITSRVIILPPGEKSKGFRMLANLCDQLLAADIERKDKIIAFGGGVIGDLTGFAAAILRRGVDFIQIPTTLLAQVDSSVGGKTGINMASGKNLVGAFHQPMLVLADTDVLNTLLVRELASGYAEIVKYGLLGDAPFFAWLEKNGLAVLKGREQERIHAIHKSCLAKAAIVAEDETEQGRRALLNLGHTFGHALEAAFGFSDEMLHGEAVALGMVQAFRFSERQGFCPPGRANRVVAHLQEVGLPTELSAYGAQLPSAEGLLALMHQDKKAENGRLTFVLAHDIGQAFIARDIADADVLAFLKEELNRT